MMNQSRDKRRKEAGFTVVELMIATAIMAFVMGSVFLNYYSQQHTQVIQNQVADMQSNIRAAMLIMTRAIREAGSDPTFRSGASILVASRGQIRITRDIAGHPVNPNEGDGDVDDPEEDITFGFNPAVDTNLNPDGIPDTATAAALCRRDVVAGVATGFVPIAERIERLEFNYIDSNGNTIPTPILSGAALNSIDAIQISILIRSSLQDPDRKFVNRTPYVSAAGAAWGPFMDGYRRRLAITTVQRRNN